MRTCFLPLLALLLNGCGAVEIATAATEGRAEETLGLLRVPVHHDGLIGFQSEPLHLRAVVIDGIPTDLQSGTTAFKVLPGEHRISAEFEDCIHWPKSWFKTRTRQHVNLANLPRLMAESRQVHDLVCRIGWNSGPMVSIRFDKVEP